MLTGIHFLLSYTCNFECDHCFLYSGPSAGGTFTISQVQDALEEARRNGSVEWIYFEGGEPFLYYPLMLEGVKRARALGFHIGVVTNAYFATTAEDARLWLAPLAELGIEDLSVSDDAYHYGDQADGEADSPPKRALACARQLGIPADSIRIEEASVVAAETGTAEQWREQRRGERQEGEPSGMESGTAGQGRAQSERGGPVVGGDVMFRGRAVEKLVQGLPRRPWTTFRECPFEDLKDPGRVHLDCYGNVHVCQGISMGNMWEKPLSELVRDYEGDAHPICGPLLMGGPAGLAEAYALDREESYVDACHFCYEMRLHLLERFPRYLAPRQVYGLD